MKSFSPEIPQTQEQREHWEGFVQSVHEVGTLVQEINTTKRSKCMSLSDIMSPQIISYYGGKSYIVSTKRMDFF